MLIYIICLHGSNCLPSSDGIPRVSVLFYAVFVPNSELAFQGTALHIVLPYTTQTHLRPDKLCSLSEWKHPEHTPAWERLKQFPRLEKIWAFPSFLLSLSHEVVKRKILTTVIIPLLSELLHSPSNKFNASSGTLGMVETTCEKNQAIFRLIFATFCAVKSNLP